MLYTRNLQETVDFYVNVLNFASVANEVEWGWAMVKHGDVELMFSIPTESSNFSESHFTGSFYINVSDVDKVWSMLKDDVKICYPIESFDYGMREFAFYDNNGYLLQFGEALEK